MFNLFKRRKEEPSQDELRAVLRSAEAEVTAKWTHFVATAHFKDEVPLADRIDGFANPIQTFLFKKYPVLQTAPGGVFWLLLFNSVAASKSHSTAQLNEAVATLKGRHARL